MNVYLGMALVCLGLPEASEAQEGPETLVTAPNPRPEELPTLSVWQAQGMTYVKSTFPNVPNFTCDTWCYESPMEFVEARALEGGRIELRHRWKDHPSVIFVTTVTPEPGAVEFRVRAELEPGSEEKLPEQWLTPNACWQLRNAPDFASQPDPYPEFVKRCFIFTEKGLTFLHQTQRGKIPVRADDDPYNNPPWVQMYGPVWLPPQEAGPTSWAAFSQDRYLYPVIGVVSRDGKYLAAIANDTGSLMAQAWHDCLHNNAAWAEEEPGGEKVWRIKIYALENDPQELLRRVGKDFPKALTLKDKRPDKDR